MWRCCYSKSESQPLLFACLLKSLAFFARLLEQPFPNHFLLRLEALFKQIFLLIARTREPAPISYIFVALLEGQYLIHAQRIVVQR